MRREEDYNQIYPKCLTGYGESDMKKNRLVLFLALLVLALTAAVLAGRFVSARRAGQVRQLVLAERQRALEAVTEYSGTLRSEELKKLEQYPNLRVVDLHGSDCYAAILAYQAAHPEQEVLYAVPLGAVEAESSDTALTLAPGDFDYDTLLTNLCYLPKLTRLTLRDCALSPEEVRALREAYGEREIALSVTLLGTEYTETTETLDLTALTPADVDAACAKLPLLPKLARVELTGEEGENLLGVAEVKRLMDSCPDVLFAYRFELFGQTVSTEDERIEYVSVPIGNEGAETLREVLPILKRCSYILLDRCGIDNELLAQLRDEFPATKIVWRLYIEYIGFLTDIKVLHLTWMWTNQNIQILRYCNEMEYFDIGHNTISDISFMAYMPNLKYAILSYNWVRDLTPLSNCKKLEMLELYFCHLLKDISPLAECENLRMLNISATAVQDISPVFGLKKLERFYCIMNYGIPEEQQEQIYQELPDCWITFNQEIDKAVGWSFDAAGGVRAQWYLDMYQIFRYRVKPYFFGDYPEGYPKGA